uniref:ATP synthase F0 subunit 6 n=1 Tax=Synelmis amoureuxi TaxID=3053537 RepID=UPI0030DE972D
MLMDIFSSFDPQTHLIHESVSPLGFWLISAAPMVLVHSSYWIVPNQLFWAFSVPMKVMMTQSMRTFGKSLKGFTSTTTGLFMLIISMNLSGLIPYAFSSTSHLITTFSLGLPLWLALIISSASFSPSAFAAHLLPSGAPSWLNPFLIIVETISISVRPITLSFRLAANMSAGHIVLGLMGVFSSATLFSSMATFSFLIATQTIYTLFEMGICLVQAYIFCLLLTLFSDDHSH